MKTRNILFLAALASTVFTGCSNDDEAGQAQLPDLSGTPIRIQAGIGEKVLTRAGEDGDEGTEGGTPQVTVLEEGEFGLFLTTTGATDDTRYNATNMKFSRKEGEDAWSSDRTEQLLWKNNSVKVNYQAYMPYDDRIDSDGSTSYTFSVKPDQREESEYKASDFLYAADTGITAAGNTEKPGAINIVFGHKLSKLIVKLAKEETAQGVTFESVELGNCQLSTTINLATGELTEAEAENESITLHAADDAEGTGTTENYECILVPQDFSGQTVTIRGKESKNDVVTEKVYRYTYNGGTQIMKSGNSYTLELSVGNKVTRVGSVSVKGWETGTLDTGDDGNTAVPVPYVDIASHSIALPEAGLLTADVIKEAIGAGTSLTVSGPMNEADLTTIATYLKSLSGTTIGLDLSDAKLTSIPQAAFMDIKSLGSVALPKVLTSIGTRAFYGSSLNGNITIPEGVETIGEYAFYGTSIGSITLPSTLHSIAGNLFNNCSSLAKIVCKGDIETVGNGIFGFCGALVEIDLSACTDVPDFEISLATDIFSDYGFDGNTKPSGITLWVNADLVDTFKAASPWNKCKVTAAE